MTASMEGRAVAAQVHLAREGNCAAAARTFVDRTLTEWKCPELVPTAVLLVSELVGNVVLHAGASSMDVVMRLDGAHLRVEVHDASAALPQRKHYSETAATGRGLALVERLAERWGAEPTPSGKRVWFELDRLASGSESSPTTIAGLDVDRDAEPPGPEVRAEPVHGAEKPRVDGRTARPITGSGPARGRRCRKGVRSLPAELRQMRL